MAVTPLTVAYATAGGILLYSGLTGDTVSNAIRSLLKGQKPSGTTTQPQVAAQPANVVASNSSGFGFQVTAQSPNGNPPIVKGTGKVSPGSLSGNQAIGLMLAAPYGWATGSEWAALKQLWDRESGWSNTIWNGGAHTATQPAGSSGAYGIAQALPFNKMPKAAWPPGYGGSASATSQISWGLAYIKGRYGSPSAAWAHEVANSWY